MASLTRWTKFEWTPGVDDGQGGLACCNSWGRKELDTTEQLNWTDALLLFTVSDLASITSHIHYWVLFLLLPIPLFFLELFLHLSPVAYWAPTNLGSSSFSVLPFLPYKKWSSHHRVNRVWIAVHGCNLKNDRIVSVHFQDKPFNITVIQVYAPTTNAEEAEQFYEDLHDLLEQTKRCPKKRSFSS